jgi:ppGpp synthetase/RelA/SpoT-type nucleotidyltranferase
MPRTRSQVDACGKRVRHRARVGLPVLDEDGSLINEFRESHLSVVTGVQEQLTTVLHHEVGLDEERFPITSRLKTPQAIVAKLRRTSTGLSRMQDIAGARIVLPAPDAPITALDAQQVALTVVLDALAGRFEIVDVKDQATEPDRWGYRAIHAIGKVGTWYFEGPASRRQHCFEVQVRTEAQDRWAQVVEGLDSRFGWDLKHGNGPADWQEWLHALSDEFLNADQGEPFTIPPMPFDES